MSVEAAAAAVYLHDIHAHASPLARVHGFKNSWLREEKKGVSSTSFHPRVRRSCAVAFQPTEHVLQAHDAGQVVVKVDVVVGIGEAEADQLQQAVVQLHAFVPGSAASAPTAHETL